MKIPHVILVDEQDQILGVMEKMEAHQKGLLHRAFSVFVFNSKGEMLLQKRAASKYHSPSLWTNACCSHPYPDETTMDAANRRLKEEMGMALELDYAFAFQYKAVFENGLIEHEYDHVFIGQSDQLPQLNPEEADAFKYVDITTLSEDVQQNPDDYTEWFKICLQQVLSRLHTFAI